MFKHVLNIETSHVDWVTSGCIVAQTCCFGVGEPVHSDWAKFGWCLHHAVANNDDAATSWSYILLGTSVNNIMLGPVDWARAEVRGHIAHNNLSFWNLFKGERSEFNTDDCFVIAVVEVLSVFVDLPCFRIRNTCIFVSVGISCTFGHVNVLFSFFDGTFGPLSSCHVVRRNLLFPIVPKVKWDSSKLSRSSTLEEENRKVIRDR